MRRFLTVFFGLIILVAAGGWSAVHWHLVANPFHATSAASQSLTPHNTTLVTESQITSNLNSASHYIRFSVSVPVFTPALRQAGGHPSVAAGGGGTGSATLDAEIKTQLTILSRKTPYAELTSAHGLKTFRHKIQAIYETIFGPHHVGTVFLPSILTQ